MVKAKTQKRRSYRGSPRRAYHKRKEVVHVLPDVLYTAGVAVPFAVSGAGSNGASAYDSVKTAFQGNTQWFQEASNNLMDSVKTNWKQMLLLLVGGKAVSYIGKKTNLGKIGTKKVKLF